MSPDGGAIEAMNRAFTALAIARNEPLVARHVGRDMPITLGFEDMQRALTALEAFQTGGPAGPAIAKLDAAIEHLTPVADDTESAMVLDAIDELRNAAEAVSLAAYARSSGR